MSLRIHKIAYPEDPATLFSPFAGELWAVFLDSGGLDRYSLIAARPQTTLTTRGMITEINSESGRSLSGACPFDLLHETLPDPTVVQSPVPFSGGAIGYFGYDLARRIERLPNRHDSETGFPDMAFGIYDWCVIIDHYARSAMLVGLEERIIHDRWQDIIESLGRSSGIKEQQPLRATEELEINPDHAGYRRAFSSIQRYILEGDCYQINFARRFRGEVTGNPWFGYLALRERSPAPFGAYFNLPEGQLLSNSPESFLTLKERQVASSPIKGTRPRRESPEQDRAALTELVNSEKDKAENLMIVDLLRNDLGRSCEYGSIRVDRLFRPASFANVHHLISDISGKLRDDEDAISLMKNCFPGGSITGAPKLRAMEIIDELEPASRGPYCGSMTCIGFDGSMRSNILIRTLMHRAGEVEFWAGGGIVADSDVEQEFQETLHKASALMSMLERPHVQG